MTKSTSTVKYNFGADYTHAAHPKILKSLLKHNEEQFPGYSTDCHCEKGIQAIKNSIGCADVDIHFLVGGTQTNLVAIAAALRPWQAVISTELGHIATLETGAIEATGHKVISVPCQSGKLTPADVEGVLEKHTLVHHVQPKMVYISNTTEIGTQYTRAELQALRACCVKNDLYLFLDGARIGVALTTTSNDLTLPMIAEMTDMFYIGGTKNGAMFGEALVIRNPNLQLGVRQMIKQRGALLAKGWLLGLQFEVLFKDNLFYELGKQANNTAAIIRRGCVALGYRLASDSVSNLLFVWLPDDVFKALEENFIMWCQYTTEDNMCNVRLCTSWSTTIEAAQRFVDVLAEITKRRDGAHPPLKAWADEEELIISKDTEIHVDCAKDTKLA